VEKTINTRAGLRRCDNLIGVKWKGLLGKLGEKRWPGGFVAAISIVIVISAFLHSGDSIPKERKSPPPPTWRSYEAPYARVWNALVRAVSQDLRFAIRVADPKEGYLATWPKTDPETSEGPQRRVQINVNVKKSAQGALVTASCIIEEYVKKGKREGRWMIVPSDNSCEAGLLDAVEKRLAAKISTE
jgi:hypothetical protein